MHALHAANVKVLRGATIESAQRDWITLLELILEICANCGETSNPGVMALSHDACCHRLAEGSKVCVLGYPMNCIPTLRLQSAVMQRSSCDRPGSGKEDGMSQGGGSEQNSPPVKDSAVDMLGLDDHDSVK